MNWFTLEILQNLNACPSLEYFTKECKKECNLSPPENVKKSVKVNGEALGIEKTYRPSLNLSKIVISAYKYDA